MDDKEKETIRERVRDAISREKDEAADTLRQLVSIKSVQSSPVTTDQGEVFPFGRGVQDAFSFMMRKAEEDGFSVYDSDHYGGHIDFGSGNETVGILGHLDVVPEGSGWEHDPFGGEIIDGFMWGRGTTDDKGPLLAAYYAMKALKDAGFVPAKRVRLIMGLDEENDWIGMDHYLHDAGAPDFGFTPDADFPALNGEKGIMSFSLAKKIGRDTGRGIRLTKMSGGAAVNMVPDSARAVINSKDKAVYDDIREQASAYAEKTGYTLKARKTGSSLEITAEGVAAHGATPERGTNAVSILFDFLGKIDFENDDVADFISFYNENIGFDTTGDFIGCALEDEKSGSLTFNVGRLMYDGGSVGIDINVRYPVSYTAEDVYERLMKTVEKNGLGIVREEDMPPVYFDPDGHLIKTLMSSYRRITGDTQSQPKVIGGGTYARACSNIAAFGGLFPGDPDIMHQKNERIELSKFYLMIEIYADALMELSGEDFSLDGEDQE
ncbi:MAG: dipeptidase PepV [Anaerovoracaceae bacterium]